MTAYALDDERAIRAGRLVEDWSRSRLLTAEQRQSIAPDLRVGLRRTNIFLRLTLFIFGVTIIQSILGLFVLALGLQGEAAGAVVCAVAAAACYGLAEFLIARYRLYRFGVEEAAVVAAVGLSAVGGALVFVTAGATGPWPAVAGLAAGAAAALHAFRRFGYVYAAIVATACAAAVPFQLQGSGAARRLAAAAVLAAIAWVCRARRAVHGPEHPAERYETVEASAWLGLYAVLNLQITSGFAIVASSSWFYWLTFACGWLTPAAALWLAVPARDRRLLQAGIIMLVATVLTTKPYLALTPQPWDAMVFGLAVMASAFGVRRWLASGPGGARFGYTAARVLASDASVEAGAAIVSAAVPATPGPPANADHPFGGGASGGAGASGRY